ncbi:CpaF/VirB11 family protein [Streptantibioticus parmotrematis]|uniref:CpaF family protein n=1 Tax=Streptantibioticus parmotrematis TaxID=2873249 RepID=UPI0033F2CB5B
MPELNGHGGPRDLAALLTAGIAPSAASVEATPVPPARSPAGQAPAAPASGAAGVEVAASLPGQLPVGSAVIQELRDAASKEATAQEAASGGRLSLEDKHQLARSVVSRLVAEFAARHAATARPLTREQEAALRTVVFDTMYRAGRVQALLDDPSVEDVLLDGDTVLVDYFDKPQARGRALFASDAELVSWVNEMAGQSGHGERQLSPGSPSVGFRLPDGSRVQASLLSRRPSAAIRRHRIQRTVLGELADWGTLSPALVQFLRACVEARKNLLIAGDMGAGKTSLLRALGRAIPEWERIVTLESDRELYLDEPGPGPYAVAFEARQSNGERSGAGDLVGEVSIADLFPVALRYNASRVIVGEVRSVEVVPMLQAMTAGGSGSMCTIHARDHASVIGRLIQLCTEAGMSEAAANHLVAHAVDVIVYIRLVNETAVGGRKHRFVSHVREVHTAMEGGQPTTSDLFAPADGEPRAMPSMPPSFLADLEAEGRLDADWLLPAHAGWKYLLQTVRPL